MSAVAAQSAAPSWGDMLNDPSRIRCAHLRFSAGPAPPLTPALPSAVAEPLTQQSTELRTSVGSGAPADDGVLMNSGLTHANKCRDCGTTIDVGTAAWCAPYPSITHPIPIAAAPTRAPSTSDAAVGAVGAETRITHTREWRIASTHTRASPTPITHPDHLKIKPPLISLFPWRRFNRNGEPGRKITCVGCHQKKVEAAGGEDAGAAPKPAEKPKKEVKKRKSVPKITPEILSDPKFGITAVYKTFPKYKFKGKRHEADDLQKLLHHYAEWAYVVSPDLEFTDFVSKMGKCVGNWKVRSRLDFVRSVEQGVCSIDDLEDYNLADRGRWHANGADDASQGIDLQGAGDPSTAYGADDVSESAAQMSAAQISEGQRMRMEANKRAALERARLRRERAGEADEGAAQPSSTQQADWDEIEAMQAEAIRGARGGAGGGAGGGASGEPREDGFAPDDEAEAFGFCDEDEEMEMMMYQQEEEMMQNVMQKGVMQKEDAYDRSVHEQRVDEQRVEEAGLSAATKGAVPETVEDAEDTAHLAATESTEQRLSAEGETTAEAQAAAAREAALADMLDLEDE